MLKTPGAALSQYACVEQRKKKFSSHQYSLECLMNKFRVYLFFSELFTCFELGANKFFFSSFQFVSESKLDISRTAY